RNAALSRNILDLWQLSHSQNIMEKFLKITKSKPNGRVPREKEDHKNRFHPYSERVASAQLARQEWFEMGQEKRKSRSGETGENAPRPANSIQAAKKHALTTLSHPGNPLTNPDALRQPDHVWSCATGHQRGDGRQVGSSLIIKRNEQLEARREMQNSSLFWGCRIYCNSGYCAGTTDIELKRLVSEYGGVVAYDRSLAAVCFHWLTRFQSHRDPSYPHFDLSISMWVQDPKVFDHEREKQETCRQARMAARLDRPG
ncbi:638_t:CDS:2, partial [Acaulospora colombiana]